MVLMGLAGAASASLCAPAADASRVAVAGGSITEILYALGEQERIVAVDRTSNYPPEALELPSLGYVRALSIEGVLSLRPTLVLGEHDMGPPEVVDRLERVGIPLVAVPETHDLAGIVAKVRCVGRVIGADERAEALIAERLDGVLTAPPPRAASGQPPRGLVLLRFQDGAPIAAGRETAGAGLLEMAGAVNALDGFEGWKPISLEAAAAAAPDFIVLPESTLEDAGGVDGVASHAALRLTPAARQGRILALDGMAMLGFGLRTAEAAATVRSFVGTSELADRGADPVRRER
jgi:iron complex transport system substrate-binding protein